MTKKKNIKVEVEVSAHHVHLSRKDVDKLFGKNYELTVFHPLSQPGEFAENEKVSIKTKAGILENVRILGPIRDYTQVEISKTEAFKLKLNPVIRESGDLESTPGATLIGPKGQVALKQGVILAYRHIHASTLQAKKYNLKHGKLVKVRIPGPRALVFENVMVKVRDNYDWHMHIDTDEADAAGVDRENNIGILIG